MASTKGKKLSLKEKIKDLIRKIDQILPAAIVGSGALSALYYPEGFKAVEALLVGYILTKGVLAGLQESEEVDPKVKELAEKMEQDAKKLLEQLGIDPRTLEEVENKT